LFPHLGLQAIRNPYLLLLEIFLTANQLDSNDLNSWQQVFWLTGVEPGKIYSKFQWVDILFHEGETTGLVWRSVVQAQLADIMQHTVNLVQVCHSAKHTHSHKQTC
jgi:hypothetical protein